VTYRISVGGTESQTIRNSKPRFCPNRRSRIRRRPCPILSDLFPENYCCMFRVKILSVWSPIIYPWEFKLLKIQNHISGIIFIHFFYCKDSLLFIRPQSKEKNRKRLFPQTEPCYSSQLQHLTRRVARN